MGKALCDGGVICPEVTFFDTYEELNEALLNGTVEVAWLGPVAYVNAQRESRARGIELLALGQRDVDRDFKSVIIGRADDEAADEPRSMSTAELRKFVELAATRKKLVGGSRDSPQAFVVPLYWLRSISANIDETDVRTFDFDIGKHGDTARGEVEAIAAVASGSADVALVSEMMLERSNITTRAKIRRLHTVPPFDHCQFAALASRMGKVAAAQFTKAFVSIDTAAHRQVLTDEGVRDRGLRLLRKYGGTLSTVAGAYRRGRARAVGCWQRRALPDGARCSGGSRRCRSRGCRAARRADAHRIVNVARPPRAHRLACPASPCQVRFGPKSSALHLVQARTLRRVGGE
jgi:ABC-type phosphate/phosphonate transport system substrate-binding protein